MAASILKSVDTPDDDTVIVTIRHTMAASYSRSVSPLATKALHAHARGWRRARVSTNYGHTYDHTYEPHICISTITYTREG